MEVITIPNHVFKRNCINKIIYLLQRFELALQTPVIGYTETSALCKFDLVISSRLKDVMRLEDEFQNILGKNITLDFENGFINIIIPKRKQDILPLKDLLNSQFYHSCPGTLKIALGESVDGSIIVGDLEIWEHILLAGVSGGGKSVCLHSIIISLIYNCNTSILRLVLIDLKNNEFNRYENIEYLLKPVIYRVDTAKTCFESLIVEMEKRYQILKENKCRDIQSYNKKYGVITHIVVIIDEFANLILKDNTLEDNIVDLAQRGRAAGIHLIIATQHPKAEVVTTLIKANITNRIAFSCATHYESQVILDKSGAEKLRKKGDMILRDDDDTIRLQCAFISEEEIDEVVSQLGPASYDRTVEDLENSLILEGDFEDLNDEGYEQFYEAGKLCIDKQKCNIWILKCNLHIGQKKAEQVLNDLQEAGVVSDKRVGTSYEILISLEDFEDNFKGEFEWLTKNK